MLLLEPTKHMLPEFWHAGVGLLKFQQFHGINRHAQHAGATGDDEAGEEVQSKLPEAEQKQLQLQAIRIDMEKRQRKKALQRGAQDRSADLTIPFCSLAVTSMMPSKHQSHLRACQVLVSCFRVYPNGIGILIARAYLISLAAFACSLSVQMICKLGCMMSTVDNHSCRTRMGQQNRSTARIPQSRDRTAAHDRNPTSRGQVQPLPPQRPPRPQQIANQPGLGSEPAGPVGSKAQPTASGGSSGREFDGECVPGTIHKPQPINRGTEDDRHASRELSFPENNGEHTHTHTHTHLRAHRTSPGFVHAHDTNSKRMRRPHSSELNG